MSVAFRPTATVLAISLALACGSPPGKHEASSGEEQGGAPETADGATLYRDWSCSACHGDDREGTDLAPPLNALAGRWNVNDLADYLQDPQSYRERDARLRELQGYYPETRMPSFDYSEVERRVLAAWLLKNSTAGAPPESGR